MCVYGWLRDDFRMSFSLALAFLDVGYGCEFGLSIVEVWKLRFWIIHLPELGVGAVGGFDRARGL